MISSSTIVLALTVSSKMSVMVSLSRSMSKSSRTGDVLSSVKLEAGMASCVVTVKTFIP